jgi:hypothetical protein
MAAAAPAEAQKRLTPFETERGELRSSDRRLPDGRPFDEFKIFGAAGEEYELEVWAEGFVPSVQIQGPRGALWTESADLLPEDRRLFSLRFRMNGDHRLILTSRSGSRVGKYHVTLIQIPPIPPPPPPPMSPPPPPPPSPPGPPAPPVERLDTVPMASSVTQIQRPCLANRSTTFGQVFDRIYNVLNTRDYAPGWFLTASGFAVTTRFERIADDGRIISNRRWDTAPMFSSLWQVFTGSATPGRYRAFIVSYGTGMRQSRPLNLPKIEGWFQTQGFLLPDNVRARRGGAGYYLQVFVYEYSRPSMNAPAQLVRPSVLSAQTHLAKAGLISPLSSIC